MGRQVKSSSGSRSAGPRRTRTAMGEYIPPPGGSPLSSLTHQLPSPAHYRPNTATILPRPASYTLKGRPDPLKPDYTPSPNKYDTSRDAIWQNGAVTMKRKDVTWPYDTRKNAHVTDGPGAGHYLRSYGDTGSGTARAMSARHREGVHAGHPNLLVRPVDTHGFSTPAPNLWMESERGPKYHIAAKLKKRGADTLGPGPAAYTLPTLAPPSPLIGEKLSIPDHTQNPAPNQYDIPNVVGTAKTFGLKPNAREGMETPAPNAYIMRKRSTPISHSMTYRPFPVSLEKRPGPAEYIPSDADLHHCPEYSCKRRCLPTFPDILHYPEHATLASPGAGTYEYDREFKDNSHPAYSVKLPLPTKPNANPAPNRYKVNQSDLRTSPRYSMGLRLTSARDGGSDGPGPAAYTPRPPSAPSASITPRRTTKQVSSAPAPNNYEIERGQTHRGRFLGPTASMKGRSTPLQYSGFPSSYMAKLASFSG